MLHKTLDACGGLLAGGSQHQQRTVLFARLGIFEVAHVFQLRKGAGDGCLVLAAKGAKLCGGQPLRAAGKIIKTHHMVALETKLGHFHGLDALDVAMAFGDAGDKFFKSVQHSIAPFVPRLTHES